MFAYSGIMSEHVRQMYLLLYVVDSESDLAL